MELTDLFKMGASLIEGNSDSATTGLDIDKIADGLSQLLTHGDGNLDLASLVGSLSQNGLGEIVGSWLGNGENKTITVDQIAALLGDGKIEAFASHLGISTDSAKNALAEVLPQVVDRATSGEGDSIVDQMLGQVGGAKGAMEMLGKMFG